MKRGKTFLDIKNNSNKTFIIFFEGALSIESRSFTVCYGGDVITQVLFLCPGLPDLAKKLCMLYPEQAKIHFKIFTQYCYSEFKENSLSKFFYCS